MKLKLLQDNNDVSEIRWCSTGLILRLFYRSFL